MPSENFRSDVKAVSSTYLKDAPNSSGTFVLSIDGSLSKPCPDPLGVLSIPSMFEMRQNMIGNQSIDLGEGEFELVILVVMKTIQQKL